MPDFVAEHLHKSENRHLHVAIKAAIAAGLPAAFLMQEGREKPKKWTNVDKKLALGWQQYQDEICPKCGVPVWYGHSENEYIDFKLHTTVCYSCQKIEQHKQDPPAGGMHYVTPEPVEIEGEDNSLPSRAEGMKTAQ